MARPAGEWLLSERRPVLVGLAAAVLSAAGFSLKAILAKLAYREQVDATTVLALRMAFAMPCYVALFAWASRGAAPLTRGLAARTVGVGVLGYYLASYLDFLGLERISAGLERLVLYLYPTMVLVLGRVFLGRPLVARDLRGAAAAYAGLALSLSAEVRVGRDLGVVAAGAGLVLLSGLAYAGYVLASGELVSRVGSLRFTALAMLGATVPMLATYGLSGDPGRALDASPRVLSLALAMALFATVVPSLLMTEGIRRLGSARAAVVGSVGPLMTLWLEAELLGESITVRALVGTVFVVGGVLHATLPPPAEDRAAAARR